MEPKKEVINGVTKYPLSKVLYKFLIKHYDFINLDREYIFTESSYTTGASLVGGFQKI